MHLTKILTGWTYPKRVIVLISVLSVTRAIISSIPELGTDESYYWTYSHFLQWNYFDHPPMIAIWIKLFTGNLWLEQYAWCLRLGSIAGCAISTWFMYKCVSLLSNERAGWFAACLYNASFYAGITAGLFILPDSPQMVFWTFSLWMIARISIDDRKWLSWILFGIGSGLCIMSKAHGIFIWFGLGFFIVFNKRSWLKNPRLYAALILALAISSPILVWNIQNDFVTFRFHSRRVDVIGYSIHWFRLLREIIGQPCINNPFNVILIVSALSAWLWHQMRHTAALSIYNYISLPLALLILFISVFRDTLPHWSGPAYITLIPLAAIRLASVNKASVFPNQLRWSLGLYIVFLIVCTCMFRFYPGNLGVSTKKELGKGDISLDNYGWDEAGKKFAVIYQDEINKGIMLPGSPLICNKWWGAHEEYYFCRASDIQMIGLGSMNDLHEYMWMNKMRKDKVNFSTAYCIVHSDENYNVYTQYENFYSKIDTAAIIDVPRNKKPSHNFYIFRLSGWKNRLPMER